MTLVNTPFTNLQRKFYLNEFKNFLNCMLWFESGQGGKFQKEKYFFFKSGIE